MYNIYIDIYLVCIYQESKWSSQFNLSTTTGFSVVLKMIKRICVYFSHNWKFEFASADVAAEFATADRKICISAHSTPFLDGILLHVAMEKFGVSDHIIYVRGLFSLCPDWCKEISNVRGFLNGEIELLKSQATFCRIFFPSGGTVWWKSGFYALAKETKAVIIVVGINYSTRSVIVDSCLSTDDDYNIVKMKAVSRLKKYGAGPIYLIMRIFTGYGCLTYDVNSSILVVTRLSGVVVAILWYLYYIR